MHGLSAESYSVYQNYGIGDEIDVKVTTPSTNASSEGKFVLTLPRLQTFAVATTTATSLNQNTIEEGEKVIGSLKSIKGMCAFI